MLFSFRFQDCQPCPLRERCTRAKNVGRTLTIYPQEQYAMLLAARQRQETEDFKELYADRAGMEGTISQATRTKGLRRSRYLGLARTHLQHVATAAAINIIRVCNWLTGERPQETPISPFLALAAQLT